MQDRESYRGQGIDVAFVDALGIFPYHRADAGSQPQFLTNNGPFMRDVAIVTAAFGNVTQHQDGDPCLVYQPEGATHTATLIPIYSLAMGMVQDLGLRGYTLAVHDEQGREAVSASFIQTSYEGVRAGAPFNPVTPFNYIAAAEFGLGKHIEDGQALSLYHRDSVALYVVPALNSLQISYHNPPSLG